MRGNTVLEVALWMPVLLLLIVGMVQFGKLTYLDYALTKILYSAARGLATQQSVNLCDPANDAATQTPSRWPSSPATGLPLISNLTPDMFLVTTQRLTPTALPAHATPAPAEFTGSQRSDFIRHAAERLPGSTPHPYIPLTIQLRRPPPCRSAGVSRYETPRPGGPRIRPPTLQRRDPAAHLQGVRLKCLDRHPSRTSHAGAQSPPPVAERRWQRRNVINYMQTNVPPMIDMDQFQNGAAGIQVQYFTQNPDGTLTAFDGNNCGGGVCIPDSVSVSVTTYQYRRFSGFFRLGPVTMPPFTTTVPMESAGYRDASGTCTE
jgi:hypothetical protein